MQLLHATEFRYDTVGGDFSTATAYDLIEGPNCSLKSTKQLLNHILADNLNPDEVVQIGVGYEFSAVLAAATLESLAVFLNGTWTSGTSTYSEGQSVATLGKKDIRFKIADTAGSTTTFKLTKMQFEGSVDWAFELNKRFYLPIKCVSTNESVFTIV